MKSLQLSISLIFFTLIYSIQTTGKISDIQQDVIYQAILTDYENSGEALFIFYAKKDGIMKQFYVKDNGEDYCECFRNPENFGKLYEIKASAEELNIESEFEIYTSKAIISLKLLPDNLEFSKSVNNELYLHFLEDVPEKNLPLVINKESFETFESQIRLVSNEYHHLFGAYVNVHQTYSATEGEKNELYYVKRLQTNSPDFDILLMAELPLNTKFSAEGNAVSFKLFTFTKSGTKIAEMTFAHNFSMSTMEILIGVVHEDLEIESITTTCNESGEELSMPETSNYKINKEGKIVSNN